MNFLLIYLYKALNLLQVHEYTDINKRQKAENFQWKGSTAFWDNKKKHH